MNKTTENWLLDYQQGIRWKFPTGQIISLFPLVFWFEFGPILIVKSAPRT